MTERTVEAIRHDILVKTLEQQTIHLAYIAKLLNMWMENHFAEEEAKAELQALLQK